MRFDALLKDIDPSLKAIAHRLDGRYTSFSDEDLYQEALVQLWAKYKNNELNDKTRSFIVQGCYFAMKNYIRTSHKKVDSLSKSIHEKVNDEGVEFIETIADEKAASASTGAEAAQLRGQLDVLLTQREREVLILGTEGLTVRQIGSRLGISHVMVVKIRKKINTKCAKFKDNAVLE